MQHPFDELTKALSMQLPRREAMRFVVRGLGSALLVTFGLSQKAYAGPCDNNPCGQGMNCCPCGNAYACCNSNQTCSCIGGSNPSCKTIL
jgi:hypothetical protein